ncbi:MULTISPECIES: Cof-type HAD-IIB family hydrolase [Streptococcus]|jgi:cof-like hydrolase|uniref:Cof-type HAD-IIB family hydrolase n=1 Tax=Streptococcus TaxID=1301 RepID=UPI0001BB5600|nr:MULTISPECIES: Cof-type HAD-IIB family hydrolase [Streptococcus]EEY80874.1 cof-like hydrolase [Streptococcus sp. 2_1_36FAA]RSJ42479.1 putative phosphatase [Streptococcus gordonii]VTT00878.1 HAD superfamily hydrolase [Streptococcus gordonii]VTT23465.1 HAD superfamily hydrolase [Streptococcus gordonii]
MTKQPIRLIISDIDGTILDNQHQVDPELKDIIPLLNREQIPFVLASARSPLGMEPIARELGLGDNPLACYNGALVIKGDPQAYETIIEHPLDKKEIRTFLELVKAEFPSVSINLYSGKDWIADRLDKWVQIEAAITGEQPVIQNILLPVLDALIPIHKLLLIDEAPVIQKLHDYLQTLDFSKTAFYLSKDNYMEVTAKHVSKEQALYELAQHYQVPLEEVMTVGDNFNDLPMLRLAGLGVAMDNAPEAVKNEAKAVTKSNNEHGVAEAIKEYVLG